MVRIKKYIETALMALLVVGGFCACSDDPQVPSESPVRHTGPILFGQSAGQVEWADGHAETRAATDIPSETPDDIGVFAFADGKNTTYVFRNQQVFYKNGAAFNQRYDWNYEQKTGTGTATEPNLWPYTTDETAVVPRFWASMRYRFFAYSPWCTSHDVRVASESYSGFNQFIWDNIPGFSGKDYVLTNEIQEINNTGMSGTTEVPTMTTPDAVHFTMRHILSRIRFFFKMSEDYRKYRKIKLNSITILTAGKVKTATFNFKNNSWDETVHWSNEQIGDADPVTLVNKENAEYEIQTTYPTEPFASVYVYPQSGFNNIKMRISYSVYESKGIKTRDGELTNNIALPDWNLKAGYYYNVKINIVPDYLYVLSDNDQDFDGYMIIKDE